MTEHTRIVVSAPGKNRRRWRAEPSVLDWGTFADWVVGGGTGMGGKYGRPYSPVTLAKTPGRRLNTNLVVRHVLTLDADNAGPDYLDRLDEALPCAALSHTTASHTPEEPRWRTLVPVSRALTPVESKGLATFLLNRVGRERFDVQASTSPVAVAYAPAWENVEYHKHDGPVLDADTWLLVAPPVEWSATDPVGAVTVEEFLDEHEAADPPDCRYGRAALDGAVADLEGTVEGSGVHAAIYHAAARGVELVEAGCWSARDLDTLREVAGGLRARRREHEFDEALASALAKDVQPDTGCRDHDPSSPGGWLRLQDGSLAEEVAARIGDRFCWSPGYKWMAYDGRVWVSVSDEEFTEHVRQVLKVIRREEEVKAGNDTNRLGQLLRLLGRGTFATVAANLRGVLACTGAFDEARDLLNVGNGVVDLRTGDLLPHDPAHRFTQITEVHYVPGATHPDWDKALAAVSEGTRGWLQRKLGQGATGHPAADDVLPVLSGTGENGKTTVLLGVQCALGDFCVPLPETMLLAKRGNEHPTEVMTLKGARLALLEELPEGDYLNMARIKRLVGTERLTGRFINRDYVSWEPTHALVVSTNYEIKVFEVDHGTWRRLAKVPFPFRFDGSDPDRPRDARLRARIRAGRGGQHEAALAWLVEGAVLAHRDGLTRDDQPGEVREATAEWRRTGNPVLQFLDEVLEPAEGHAVRAGDLFERFRAWMSAHNRQPVTDATFWTRVEAHEWFTGGVAERRRTRSQEWSVSGGWREGERGRLLRLVVGVRFAEGEEAWDL